MVQLFIFTSLIQTVLITVFLGTKASKKNTPSILFFLVMFNYTLVLFKAYWNANMVLQLTKLYLPFSYAAGPVFYYFVYFSFLPTKNQRANRWLLWFVPFGLQLATAVVYWVCVAFNSAWAIEIENFAKSFYSLDFFYFIAFFIATIVFLVRHNPLITMNLVYKKQLKWLKYFMFFIALFIIDEFVSLDDQMLFSSLIACAFTSTFVYLLLSDTYIFNTQKDESKELLKEALNEREKAVVITNAEKIVEYVNEPFLTIVGYRHRDVIGRKLSFLRGNLTTPESIEFMREKLAQQVDFEVDIVNYRKNGEAYICHIVMIPVISDEKLTHFIAYEEDVKTIAAPAPVDEDWLIFEKIKAYFKENEPCKNPQLQVADIADPLGLPARRVGEVLKRCSDQSFTEFVNSSRIKGALKMLRDPDCQHLTVEAIGQMSGFNSKSIFYTAFKKETGKTPKVFLEEEEVI